VARVLVIGGTGVASGPCTTALLAAGHEVVLLRRGTPRPLPEARGFATELCDRNDRDRLSDALRRIAPDIVIDFACFTEDQAEGLLAALLPGCRQLIFVSTVDVYGLPLARLPMPEAAPWTSPGSAYALAKRAVEARLKAALEPSGAALTIVRPTYSLGETFLISLFDRSAAELVARLRTGAPILLPDGGCRLIHPSDARDTGAMVALAAGAEAAFGRDYTVGTPRAAMSQKAYLETIARALNVRPRFREVAAQELELQGVLDPGSLWCELTCHDLAYDLSHALADLPGFRAEGGVETRICAYAARLDPAADGVRAQGPEARAIAALDASGG
jgi:nucleoside-diphosphate-sugar epimerase